MLDPEDCIMDFKAEEKIPQSTVLEFEDMDSDSNTISASEGSSPTPALLCKLRKARVRIKKLPAHILEKYNLNMKKSTQRCSAQPSRVSKRLGGKSVPGHYLSLHVNKPLNEVVNKKKRQKENLKCTKISKTLDKRKRYAHILRIQGKNIVKSSLARKENNNNLKSSRKATNLTERNVVSSKTNKVLPVINTRKSSLSNLPDSQFLNSSLCEKIPNTKKINSDLQCNKPVATITLPNFPDVIITRYDLPSNNITETPNNSTNVETSSVQNSKTCNNIVSSPNLTPITSKHKPRAFPIIISSMNRLNETPYQPPIINAAINIGGENLQPPQTNKKKHLSSTVQTITIPPTLTKSKHDAIIMDASKVLPNKQTNPLNVNEKQTNKISMKDKENLIGASETESYNGPESDIELLDETKKRPQAEIIKRIIFHTKCVQTKFTCPSNICGLVNSDDFNLNCFYCYDIFPLHKWLEFKQHIKQVHHVEEKAIQSDSEEASSDEQIQKFSSTPTTKIPQSTQTINLVTKDLPNKLDLILTSKKTSPEKAAQITKKLPLEPKIVAERQGNSNRKIVKESSSTNLNLSKNSNQSKHDVDDIISLDSLDSNDDDFKDIDEDNDEIFAEKQNGKNPKQLINGDVHTNKSQTDDITKLLPPSLSHITIKKVVSPSNSTNATGNNILTTTAATPLKETFIKIPSNFNIQQIIQSLPKPSAEQLNANGTKRPRYFVVKKILKPAISDKEPNIKISQGTILTKMSEPSKDNNIINLDDDDMPSNDENEDDMPKPTNGCGIIFGITNRMVVIEFLLRLKTYPILWRPQLINDCKENYDQGIKAMCEHLNNRFELNIQDYEMRLSIQRVKTWYSRMLNRIHEHNKNCNNLEPYHHKFPLYFKILNQFLTSDIRNKTIVTTSPKKPMDIKAKDENDATQPSPPTIPPKISSLPEATPDDASQENLDSSQNVIEFDGDTFYEFESSDEEILEEFDETLLPKLNKKYEKENKPRRTRIYLGKFECDICKKVFKRVCDLKRHKVHHFPPQFECAVCTQKFYFKCWAERCNHMKKKYENVSTEENVDDSTSSSATERIVVRPKRIWPKKIFRFKMICEICGASYRSIGSLNCHKRDKHLNQRLKCIVCNFTALTNYRIVQHQKKRHIVEPGTVEEVAKKSRARMDTKTPFSIEARQEFDWRREMRAKLKPGEIFYGCCKCRIVFNTRKEKVLHNKMEHPIKETTVVCLLCLPNKLLLSNSNGARRHYTDIHKVPWDEIDALVKRTKPIFNILSKEEIELLNASENYKELLEELLKDREIEPKLQKVEIVDAEDDEALRAIQSLPYLPETTKEDVTTNYKVDVEYNDQEEEQQEVVEEEEEEQVFIDGIIDHDYNNEEVYRNDEHNYSEEQLEVDETNNEQIEENAEENENVETSYVHQNHNQAEEHIAYHIECSEEEIRDQEQQQQQNAEEYMQNIVNNYVEGVELAEGDLVEECIVVEEECINDIVEEEDYY